MEEAPHVSPFPALLIQKPLLEQQQLCYLHSLDFLYVFVAALNGSSFRASAQKMWDIIFNVELQPSMNKQKEAN